MLAGFSSESAHRSRGSLSLLQGLRQAPKYSIKFLEDPKKIYGDTRNWTVATKNFRSEHPRAAQFLSRYTLFEKQMSNILVWIDEEGMKPDAAAQRFVDENPDLIWYMIGDLGADIQKPTSLN
jgi:hypothetical protein